MRNFIEHMARGPILIPTPATQVPPLSKSKPNPKPSPPSPLTSLHSHARAMSSSATALRPSPPFRSLSGGGRRRKVPLSSSSSSSGGSGRVIRCGLADLVGGDLVKPDLGRWLEDVETHRALAVYSPHEGGYEGRYLNRLRYKGYRFLDLSARGLGDPEATLTKIHPVCPPHLGKQPIARWYFPPEVDYRLSLLPPDAIGLVVWIIEAKVLSKAELQFISLLPTLRPKVRVIAECGNWRKFVWKPLKEIAGLPSGGD